MNPTVTLETITPEIAKQMLEQDVKAKRQSGYRNRALSESTIVTLTEQMSQGKWRLNGSTIVLNGSELIDGQHRLHSVIRSKVSIQTLVVRGVSIDSFSTIDRGKKRSPADILSIAGEGSPVLMAATLRMVYAYHQKSLPTMGGQHKKEVLELIKEYPYVRQSVIWAISQGKRTSLVTMTVLATAHAILSQIDIKQAEVFLEALVSGVNIGENSPLYWLRSRLEKNLASISKVPKGFTLAYIIKAWNAQRQNKTIGLIRYTYNRDTQEEFPEAI